jgi:hypothetical protein
MAVAAVRQQRLMSVKTKTAVGVLMVTAVETLAPVVAVVTADGESRWQQQTTTMTVTKAGSAVLAMVTVAKAVADNNRNCGGRQQSIKCGRRY